MAFNYCPKKKGYVDNSFRYLEGPGRLSWPKRDAESMEEGRTYICTAQRHLRDPSCDDLPVKPVAFIFDVVYVQMHLCICITAKTNY